MADQSPDSAMSIRWDKRRHKMKPAKKHHRTTTDRPLSILLAEDDLEMRKLLSWSLGKKGYKIIECADGTSLMKKLGLLGPGERIQHHDLIISDIRMPGVTGLQVLESAREFPDFPPMILITAFPDAESRDQAMRLGAAAMLAKPFDIEELIEQVKATVSADTAGPQKDHLWFKTEREPTFPFDITFRHDTGSEAARDYIRSVATRLHYFAEHVVSGKIIIDQSGKSKQRYHRYTVTLILSTSGKPIVVKHKSNGGAGSDNLYMAVNIVFGTASRKLKHYIKKRQEYRKHATRKIQFQDMDEQDEND
jgi:CheY-like chemotaxis protein/ribosome-associated translation inhibitor RaiA